jgi:hypothetical protein
MGNNKGLLVAGLITVEAAVLTLALAIHSGFTAEYGDVTELSGSAFWSWAAPVVVGALALVALAMAKGHRLVVVAIALPVLAVATLPLLTRAALQEKLDVQFDSTPQCVSEEDMGPGPGTRAERESQRAFDSIEHVGHFPGGGASGVVGCDRALVLSNGADEADVLDHYRETLPEAGWRVVTDEDDRLRAERDTMAFEVVRCDQGGVVWAGSKRLRGGASCSQDGTDMVGPGAEW